MSQSLRGWSADTEVLSVSVADDKLVRQGAEYVEALRSQQVISARRRGKYSVLELSEHAVVMHFRMTGKLALRPRGRRVRGAFAFSNGVDAHFVDTRRLGTWDVVRSSDLKSYFEDLGLGPEPWPERRSAQWWADRFEGMRQAIKPALMRQEKVAGLGNILASEVLFRAGIHPLRTIPEMGLGDWELVSGAFREVVSDVLAAESGEEEIAYVGEGGSPSASGFAVYGLEGVSCTRCGETVVRFKQSGRSTFACPGCQIR